VNHWLALLLGVAIGYLVLPALLGGRGKVGG
jgi:hypothetical protein